MAEEASTWIGRLWQRLGLGSYAAPDDGPTLLDVDGLSIRLFPSPTGRRIIVEADIGFLPEDIAARARITRRLLNLGLGFMTTSRAAIMIADAGAGRRVVRAVGTWALGNGGLEGLIAVIDDVVYRTEFHRPELTGDGAPRGPQPVRAQEREEDMFFIRL